MRIYLASRVLIVDEVGYLPLDPAGAMVFFQLVSARYEKGSVILTSNKGFADWGEVSGDQVIATAILDRLLHHSYHPRRELPAQGETQGGHVRQRNKTAGRGLTWPGWGWISLHRLRRIKIGPALTVRQVRSRDVGLSATLSPCL